MRRERVRRRKTNRRAFLQRIASCGDKEASASIVVDGYYAGVGDYSPFVKQTNKQTNVTHIHGPVAAVNAHTLKASGSVTQLESQLL